MLHQSLSHPITITGPGGRVRVRLDGKVIADSIDALTLHEASYPPVVYIPLADVDASALQPSKHTTYCPFKGVAGYYSVRGERRLVRNAAWTYEAPRTSVAPIKGHVAFYPHLVDAIVEDPG